MKDLRAGNHSTMQKGPLLVSLVVLSAVAGGSFAYGWNSIEQLSFTAPDEISETPAAAAPHPRPQSPDPLQQAPETAAPSKKALEGNSIEATLSNVTTAHGVQTLVLDESELNQLVSEALLSQEHTAKVLAHARSFSTKLESDRIETGAVVNLSEIPLDGLPTDIKTGLTQLLTTVPMLGNRDIYLGIIASPEIQDDQISLQDLNIKLGQFTLPMTDVSEHLGISQSDIEQRLNAAIRKRGINLENIQIMDQTLVLTGNTP